MRRSERAAPALLFALGCVYVWLAFNSLTASNSAALFLAESLSASVLIAQSIHQRFRSG